VTRFVTGGKYIWGKGEQNVKRKMSLSDSIPVRLDRLNDPGWMGVVEDENRGLAPLNKVPHNPFYVVYILHKTSPKEGHLL